MFCVLRDWKKEKKGESPRWLVRARHRGGAGGKKRNLTLAKEKNFTIGGRGYVEKKGSEEQGLSGWKKPGFENACLLTVKKGHRQAQYLTKPQGGGRTPRRKGVIRKKGLCY